MSELLLDRYQKLQILKTTSTKSIQLYNNRNTGQRIIAKAQPSILLKDSKIRNVLHQASFTQSLQGYRGIPSMFWSGKTKDQRIVLLLEELGDLLFERFIICESKFSLKTVCMIGVEMLEIVKTVHDKGYVIQNVDLRLFQFGKGEKSLNLYINDLGECLAYRDSKTMAHILTPRPYFRCPLNIFESVAVYKNIEKSRKDDIQSVFFILIYLLKGRLPWSLTFKKQKIYKPPTKQFIQQFQDSKLICEGCPKVFLDLLEDCRALKFQQEPPYHWYILKLKSLLYFSDESYDFVYDWMLNRKYIEKEAIKMRNPNIVLDKDNQFLQYLQKQIFPYIDADEINTKYQFFHMEEKGQRQKNIESRRTSQIPLLKPQEQELDPYEQQEIKKMNAMEENLQKNKELKNGQKIMQTTKNNILERKKKNKEQCRVM